MISNVADFQNIRARIESGVKERWDAMLVARKISQQDALSAVMRWIVGEDAITQLMIFEQTEKADHSELSKIVLQRLATEGKRRK